jgi:hypothetical protein
MGRRALQDEVLCAAALLSLWLLSWLVVKPPTSKTRYALLIAAALASATLTAGIKESFLMYYPAIAAMLFLLAPPPRLRTFLPAFLILALAPILSAAIFCVLSHSVDAYFALWRINTGQIDAPFARAYQSGPFDRPLFDLLLLSPIVTMLAIAGAGRAGKNAGVNALTGFALVALTVFGLFSSKNARYVIVVDPIDRLLAASLIVALPRRPWLPLAVIALVAATELSLFYTLFEIGDLFDPLTYNLLKVLRVIP